MGTIPCDEICYWSPSGIQAEVDFLLRFGKRFVAIEVKAGSGHPGSSLSGLRAIADLQGLRRRILVYLGRTTEKTADGIEILPLQDFLEAAGRSFNV